MGWALLCATLMAVNLQPQKLLQPLDSMCLIACYACQHIPGQHGHSYLVCKSCVVQKQASRLWRAIPIFVAGRCVTSIKSVVRHTYLTKNVQSQPGPGSAVSRLGGGALCCGTGAATTGLHWSLLLTLCLSPPGAAGSPLKCPSQD